jgi:glutamine synthetase adenylyltransferase
MNELPDILVQDLEGKWEAFEQSCAQHNIRLPQDPQILQILQRVFAFSDFVAENCIRHPALISDLIESGDKEIILNITFLKS